jgi:putative sterol carrier protein
MPVFKDLEKMKELYSDLWNKMIKETEFGKKLKESEMTILFRVSDPDAVMFVDENGAVFGEQAEAKVAVVTMVMDSDTAHRFWLKKVNIPKALALRQIKAKGAINKVLQILPLLKPGQDLYPGYCKKYGLPMDV